MKTLITIVLLTFSSFTFALECSHINQMDLPKEAKVTLQKQCLDMSLKKDQPVLPSVDTLTTDNVEEFTEKADVVVTSVSKLIKSTAKDLNVAVNEFVTTPVGIMTSGIIVYHYLGKDFIVWFKDFLILTAFLIIANILCVRFRKSIKIESVEEVTVKGVFGQDKIIKKPIYTRFKDLGEDGQLCLFITGLVQFVVLVIWAVNI